MFMSKTVICVLYLDYCIFYACSIFEFDNDIKSFKDNEPSYNW